MHFRGGQIGSLKVTVGKPVKLPATRSIVKRLQQNQLKIGECSE